MIWSTILMALREVRRNTMRSVLTTLGIVIGVASVIAMVTLGRGATAKITADIANMGERMGGGLVAGLFLKEFVGEVITWAHLDIAGPAFNEAAPFGYTPKGGTGSAVRTLVRLAEKAANGEIL